MKAYHLTGTGVDSLRQVVLTDRQPGPREVKVKVRAASVNYRDHAICEGIYLPDLPKPLIPLSDGAGIVTETGPGVSRLVRGDRVMGHYTTAWLNGPFSSVNNSSKLGGPVDGWLAEAVIMPESALLPVPEHLSLEEAASLPVSGLTAWTALNDAQDLSDRYVLIEGTGSVSLMALQVAHAAGAHTVVLTAKRDQHETLYAMGANAIIDYRCCEDPAAAILHATDGHGIDWAVEVVGGNHLLTTLAAMADNGIISVVGFLDGYETCGSIVEPMLAKRLQMRAVSAGNRVQFEEFGAFLLAHNLHPVIGKRHAFRNASDAFRAPAEQGFGKPLVVMPE